MFTENTTGLSEFCTDCLVISTSQGSPHVYMRLGTQVRSLDREDILEEIMATHSSILAWRIPWTEEPGGLQSVESQS